MKTADIVVGEEYGWEPWKGATLQRVKVLATGLDYKSPYGYSRKATKTGVRIIKLSGEQRGSEIVPAREISRPWAPIAAARAEAARYRQEATVHARQQRAARAATVIALSDLLREACVEGDEPFQLNNVNERLTYANADTLAQEAAGSGLMVVVEEGFINRVWVIVPRQSLGLYWLHGTWPSLPVSDLFSLANLGLDDPDAI